MKVSVLLFKVKIFFLISLRREVMCSVVTSRGGAVIKFKVTGKIIRRSKKMRQENKLHLILSPSLIQLVT